ncbi:MAG: hypothetical protein J6Y82_11065 [Bacteroidales bacterium]|nr:hypothetical protein [Bacteroidales bacterium]
MPQQEIFEESVLQAIDTLAEHANEQTTKIIVDLFKSAVLKKYKYVFNQELAQGIVNRKTIDKAVEFYFSDICFSIRVLSKMSDDDKDRLIQDAKRIMDDVKKIVEKILVNKGIDIVS